MGAAVQGYRNIKLLLRGSLQQCRCIYRFQSTNHRTETTDEVSYDEDYLSSEDPVNTERNVSRLDPNHYRQYHGLPPELSYKNMRMRRKLFAKYGMQSEEDPRMMWPTRTELLHAEEEEMEERLSLQQRLKAIQSQRELEERNRLARHKTIEKNMAQMPKMIADYQARLK